MPEEDGEVVLPDERIEMRRAEISQAKSEIMEEAQDVGIHAMVKESIESGESERGEVLSALQTPERIDDGITDMNLSNGNSKRIAMGIQSYEGKKDGYFDTVRSSIVANQNLISSSRMQSVSNLNPGQIIAELLVEGEKYTTTTALQVSTCQSNGNPLGHNMQCILTNKRMILVDSDDDVVNTITGSYKGTFPRSNNLDLVSQNYFSLLFKPFRISDVTDISVNFRYGSETRKTLKRGWSIISLMGALIFSAVLLYALSPNIAVLSVIVPLLMLVFPINNETIFPVHIMKVRQLNITIVNAHTRHVENLVLDISDIQSIESALEWTSVLQSLSSATAGP